MCSLLPYNKSYFDRYVPLLHLALIYSLGYAASLLLRSGSIGAYSGLLLLTALGCGMLETHVLSMRTAVSWIMIGVIYSSFKFTHYTAAELTIKNLLLVFTIAIVGTLAAMFVYAPKKQGYASSEMSLSCRNAPRYLRIALPLLAALGVWQMFAFKEVEWLLWSAISVASLELEASATKVKHRLLGGAVGIAAGFVVSLVIPASKLLNYLIFICMMLTFRVYDKYYLAFTSRCFFIVLYANNHISIGITRITNVLVGAIVGYIVSLILYKWQCQRAKRWL